MNDMMDGPGSREPFIDPLEQIGQGRRETFHQLESRPDLFVRRRDARHYDTEQIKFASERFDDLRRHNVNVPEFSVVVGEDSSGVAEFWVADKVHGEALDALVAAKAELPSEIINRTFKGIAEYLQDAQKDGSPVFWDFALRQFMLGHTASNLEDDIYLVDIDPGFRKLDGEILIRVTYMMQSVHALTPIEDETWAIMRKVIIANDTGRTSEEELKKTMAWMEDNLPPATR